LIDLYDVSGPTPDKTYGYKLKVEAGMVVKFQAPNFGAAGPRSARLTLDERCENSERRNIGRNAQNLLLTTQMSQDYFSV
jgi:hypothetical protein